MSKLFGALAAFVVMSSLALPAHAIMAIRKFSIHKPEFIFTDKAALKERFEGSSNGDVLEFKSSDGLKTARSKIYSVPDGDFAVVEVKGYGAPKDGLYLVKSTPKGNESVRVQDTSVETIEQLEQRVLQPAKLVGMDVSTLYGGLEMDQAPVILVDDSGDYEPQENRNRYYDRDREPVPRREYGGYDEQPMQHYPPSYGGQQIIVLVPVLPVFPVLPPPCRRRCGGGFFIQGGSYGYGGGYGGGGGAYVDPRGFGGGGVPQFRPPFPGF